MTSRSHVPPRTRIVAECERRGAQAVAEGCRDLLLRRDVDDALVLVLGGEHAENVLAGRDREYWLRVWAARGLLWAYDDLAHDALLVALADDHWRVREMACKVVARHEVDGALSAVVRLSDDAVPRVRAAAARAVRELTEARA